MMAEQGLTRTRKFWMGVVSKDHVSKGVKEGIAQFCHGKKGPANRPKEGDFLIYYSPKVTMDGNEICQELTAIGQFKDDHAYQYEMSEKFKPFRRDVKYFDTKSILIKQLIDDLPFIKNKRSWGAAFRYGFLEIDKVSFKIIAKCMMIDYSEKILEID